MAGCRELERETIPRNQSCGRMGDSRSLVGCRRAARLFSCDDQRRHAGYLSFRRRMGTGEIPGLSDFTVAAEELLDVEFERGHEVRVRCSDRIKYLEG